ncbi:MAG: IS110 family transposase [Gammaproteobacteria bacterium]|nr:IS110 family transposase [Gammaproteobacteria bacterium]
MTKRGNRYLRKQLIHGARAAMCWAKSRDDRFSKWVNQLVKRIGVNEAPNLKPGLDRVFNTDWLPITEKARVAADFIRDRKLQKLSTSSPDICQHTLLLKP